MGRTLVGGSASSPGSWNWVVCSTEMGLVLNDSAGCRPPSPAPARHCPIAANGARAHVWDCSVAPSLPGFTPFPSLSRPCLLSSRLSLTPSLYFFIAVRQVRCGHCQNNSWSTATPRRAARVLLLFGLRLDSDHCWRISQIHAAMHTPRTILF